MSPAMDLGLADAVRTARLSATEIAERAASEARHDRSGSFWALDEDRMLREAARIDGVVAEGRDPGPLAGVPVAVKDCFDVEGLPTSGGVALQEPRIAR